MQFEEYVAVRGSSLLRFAFLLSRDPHTAEDLVQSALADAYRHWRRVSRADHPDAYVRKIVLNTYLGWRRRRWTGETPVAFPPDLRATPDHAEGIAARESVRQMIDQIAPRARAILVLRYYEDLNDHAIAELLGIAPSTVRATATRALASLRSSAAAPIRDSNVEESP